MAEVEARRLEMDQVVPDFILPSVSGGTVSPREFKQKCNLVIAYLHLERCDVCLEFLRDTADNYHVYQELETQILAVAPFPISDLQAKVGSLGLPFPVLWDEGGDVGEVYLGGEEVVDPLAGIFVTDRFGALQTKFIVATEQDLPNQESILDWLNLIEMECPECGPGDVAFRR